MNNNAAQERDGEKFHRRTDHRETLQAWKIATDSASEIEGII
ncbi:hypothetical protein [Azotobacter beijerinckii]|nr:hypothetical protein [Azotobacter beijerinckii]